MREPRYQTEVDRAPAMRISHIFHGRINEGTRVKYLVDPTGAGSRRAIPEKVVLYRWRKWRMEGVVFYGCRLSPTIWRAIKIAFPIPANWLCALSIDELSRMAESKQLTPQIY
jgi:hypothetical protein